MSDEPHVTTNDAMRAPFTCAKLLNDAANLFHHYGLDQTDDVKRWLDERVSLTDGSLG